MGERLYSAAHAMSQILEQRTCIIGSNYCPDPFSLEPSSLRHMAGELGVRPLDIDKLRVVLEMCAERFADIERELPGHVCTSCGYIARHSAYCAHAKAIALAQLST